MRRSLVVIDADRLGSVFGANLRLNRLLHEASPEHAVAAAPAALFGLQ